MSKSKFSIRKYSNAVLCMLIAATLLVCFYPVNEIASTGATDKGVYYGGNKDKRQVSLMINVYENTEVVCDMLDTLKSHGKKATFFVGGCWADDNQETLVRIAEEGHELGNHGYFHKDHKKLNEKANYAEIYNNHRIVLSLTGVTMKTFTPPSGSYGADTLKAAEKLGYTTVMWTKDTIDWKYSDEQTIYDKATKNIQNGDIILIHPKSHTAKVLDKILTHFEEIGMDVVTVAECLE